MVTIPQSDLPVATERIVRADARLMLREIDGIMQRMCTNILAFAPLQGRPGSDLRTAVGHLQVNISKSVFENTLPDKIVAVFDAAYAVGIPVPAYDPVIAQLEAETPRTNGAIWTAQASIMFALAAQCQTIADLVFVNREEVDKVQAKMKSNFDNAKEWAADDMDNIVYGKLVDLAAKLARYLADTALPLPTIVWYELRPMPALTVANRIYGDAARTDQILLNNRTVHPAFMRSTVQALSI